MREKADTIRTEIVDYFGKFFKGQERGGWVVGMCRGDINLAEELVTNVCEDLYVRAETIQNSDNIKGYINRTIKYKFIDLVENNSNVVSDRYLLENYPVDQEGEREVFFDSEIVNRKFKLLPDKHREILKCRYLNEMTEKEIAVELGIPIGTVKSRTRRAIDYLKKKVERRLE